jgi:hypothetical protein
LEVKHRQLARQVGVFIEHPLANSMVFFNFTSAVLVEGTTFVFGLWVCVAGGFRRHLINDMKLEASVAAQCSDLDKFIDNLAREIEEDSAVDATSTHAAPGLLRSSSIRSEEERTRLPFGLCNAASVYRELTQSEFLSALEEDLDNLLKIGDEGATTCQEAPVFDKYLDSDDDSETSPGCHLGLTITSTQHGRFVYWKGMEPSELLEFDSRLVVFTQELPFQEVKPLSPIIEEEGGGTVLVDYSSSGEFSPQHHVYMASLYERDYDDELLADVSADERTTDAPQDKDKEHRRMRRIKNAKHAKRMRNAEARARNPPHRRNLNGAFAAADDPSITRQSGISLKQLC